MNYSLSVHSDKTKEFSENDETSFKKRNKLSSKCVDKILESDYKFESPPITGNQRKLGLPVFVPFAIKPYSSININSKSLKLQSPNQMTSQNGNIAIKCKDTESLDNLLSNCIKEGREFEDTLRLLESQNLIESNAEETGLRKQSSAGSSEQEDDN